MPARSAPGSPTSTDRELLAERLAARLDTPVTVAGVLFVLLLVADRSTPAGHELSQLWTIASWVLWSLFVVEFVLRMIIAPSTAGFLRRNWWQVVFLALPFLRFLRGLSRGARLARGLSTSVRGSRTAGQNLTGRLGWLVSITLAVVLGTTELLYEFGGPSSYPDTLHSVTLTAISGSRLELPGVLAKWLELVLALYATVFFASLAGSLGAFWIERRGDEEKAVPE